MSMDILKIATDCAKAEVLSTSFFVLCGIGFIALSFSFWQFAKTDLARAYIIPALVVGSLLLIIGIGLFFTNKSRVSSFSHSYEQDASTFVKSEITRVEHTLKEYKIIVFTIIPLIVSVCAVLLVFMDKPLWRASAIMIIAMMVVILLIDGLAHARIELYKERLLHQDKK